MKHYIRIFIAQFLITISLAHGMEITTPSPKTKCVELTAVQHPHQALYLTDTTALVLHRNGCSIVDTIKNTEIKKICDHPNLELPSGIEPHPDGTKMAFFYHTKNSKKSKIAIYDLITGKKEWSKKCLAPSITSVSFNPSNDTIGVCHGKSTEIYIYNYTTKEAISCSIKTTEKDDCKACIKFHPTQASLMYIGRRRLFLADMETQALRQLLTAHSGENTAFNINGSCIARYGDILHTIIILRCSKNGYAIKRIACEKSPYGYCRIKDVQFHPNNAILAVAVGDANNSIMYWDIETLTLICQPISSPHDKYYANARLSFSPNGKSLLCTQYNASHPVCVIMPLPFEALYHTITKKQMHFLSFMLNNYNIDQQPLPKDIIKLLMQTLLEVHKR